MTQRSTAGYKILIFLQTGLMAAGGGALMGCGNGSGAEPVDTTPIAGGGRWRSFARPPAPLHEPATGVLDGRIYYVGGRLQSGPLATLYRYDPPPVDGWKKLASFPGTAVDHMGAAAVDGILYAMGGTIEWPGPSVANVYAYDPATDQWSIRASMPKVLGIMGVGVVGGKIYCIGGLSNSEAVNFVFEYDPVENQWTDLTSTSPMPTARDHCIAATVDGKIHMIGGRQVDIGTIMRVHEVFDPATGTWETRAQMPTARAGFSTAVLNGKILVMGGEGSTTATGVFSQNEEYDPATDTWRILSPMTAPRHSTQAGVIDDVVYVAAGSLVIGRTFTDVNEGFSFAFE